MAFMMFEAGTGWLLDYEEMTCLDMIWFCPVTFAYEKRGLGLR
jgi:hypothetical protein